MLTIIIHITVSIYLTATIICPNPPNRLSSCIRLPHGTVNLSQPAKPALKLHSPASRHRHLSQNLTYYVFPCHPAELRSGREHKSVGERHSCRLRNVLRNTIAAVIHESNRLRASQQRKQAPR